ncbi:alpha/beta hydrolase [Enhygromyxa salina]|nr:alpha/beta hydrolase [Enhygromyxa salina]
MRLPARTRRAVTQGLFALSISSGCGPEPGDAQRSAPSIELTDCGGAAIEAKCGVLHVEENRDAPNGRTIALSILVAPATSRTPASDPVFLLAGGPGQGAAALAGMVLHPLAPVRRDRDMVFVDVRGTGESGPLACDVERPDDLEELLGGVFEISRLDACLASYAEDQVDLTQYTTTRMVDDLDEVRAALGYGPINLLAISYGTVVAQDYMRRYPEQVRSAVLDGAVPVSERVLLGMPANTERALKLVFAECREQPECASAYPGLERKLEMVLTDLEQNRVLERVQHPRTGEQLRVDITRAGFTQVLGGALYSGTMTALVPLLIERAHVGDYGPLAAVGLRMAKMSKSVSMGLYLSVSCAEQLASVNEASRREVTAGLEHFSDHALAQLEQACARWPHATVDAEFRQAVESSVPTLLLSGRFDPVTPPSLAEQLAGQLGNARHVEVASISHGVWHNGCAPALIASFFATPDPAAVDAGCLTELARPRPFLGPNGPWRASESAAVDPDQLDQLDQLDQPEHPTHPDRADGVLAQGQPLRE